MVPTALSADLELTKPKLVALGLQATGTSRTTHQDGQLVPPSPWEDENRQRHPSTLICLGPSGPITR